MNTLLFQSEVDQILADAETEDQAENIRIWYDGYHFSDFNVNQGIIDVFWIIQDKDGITKKSWKI
ncbi:MAG: hypothetical protein V8T65_17605 [Roseburia inulinivorans]